MRTLKDLQKELEQKGEVFMYKNGKYQTIPKSSELKKIEEHEDAIIAEHALNTPDYRFQAESISDIIDCLGICFSKRHKGKFSHIEFETEGQYMYCGFAHYNYSSEYKASVQTFVLFKNTKTNRSYELYMLDWISKDNLRTYDFDDYITEISQRHTNYIPQ